MAEQQQDSLQDSWDTDELPNKPVVADTAGHPHDASVLPETTDEGEPERTTAIAPFTALQQYLAEVRRYPFLTKEEELRLFEEYRRRGSRQAAVKMILANLRGSLAISSE